MRSSSTNLEMSYSPRQPSREKLLDSLFMTKAAINSKKLMKSVPLLETDLFLIREERLGLTVISG